MSEDIPPLSPPERLRRPVPERTQPRRAVLGAFGHRDWQQNPQGGHPLGPGFDDPQDAPSADPSRAEYSDEAIRDASDLIDRHIDDDMPLGAGLGVDSIEGLAAALGTGQYGDLTETLTKVVRNYSDIASVWIEMISIVRDMVQSKARAPAPDPAEGPNAANSVKAPVLCVQAPIRVEAKIEMFRPASESLRLLPLVSDHPAKSDRIADVALEDGQAHIVIPPETTPGNYHGLIFENQRGPVGVVSVRIPPPEGDAK